MKNNLLTPRALALCAFLSLSLMACEWKKPSAQASVVALSGNAASGTETTAEESAAAKAVTVPVGSANEAGNAELPAPAVGSAASIMARPQIPILCYHQIRDYRPTDSRSAKDYIIPPADFKAQMKGLADSGYTTILPAQLYEYLVTGKQLPPKPVMLTFDDGCDEQFEFAHSVLNPLKFKGAYFIMTVSVNRPNYMKAEQIRQLADEGHAIGLHTWDHHNVKQYQGTDWQKQIEQPKLSLEKITGRPIQFFAYPFGLWNPQAIPQLKDRGLMAAFQLSTARDANDPLYTIRRIIVPGGWSGAQLVNRMKNSFH
ncbi:polysaccharide deacetylase family protein [Flavihumibacter petaseus]|uniref:Putative polysaccharide deacetylase n=1 Tax=Flavihumibacter petaseus NBRC 106054 TaxID=1220578 RepID=A0A0E9N2S0_9BACT|nr:polysaccharide deacetylase family protein [Flavihumibacter petaseus]GAO43630.1 putative polysaccharide deacetylase [Flavihumibacter petaseus NBRC 106054]